MFKYIYSTILFCLILFSTGLKAQENCTNGIDDDGDGLIDCYDPQCVDSIVCSDFFFRTDTGDTACRTFLPPANVEMQLLWQSELVMSANATVMAADVDNDGTTEVLTSRFATGLQSRTLILLNGINGVAEDSFVLDSIAPFYAIANANGSGPFLAVGDIDGDSLGEYAMTISYANNPFDYFLNTRGGLIYLDDDLSMLWMDTANIDQSDAYNYPSFVDFDGDDTSEIYIGRNIFDPFTGNLIMQVDTPYVSGTFDGSFIPHFSIAADVLPGSYCPSCDGNELILGNKVYAIDIPNQTWSLQTTAPNNLPYGLISIADFNQDSLLDVVIKSTGINDTSYVYVFDPRTGSQIGSTFLYLNNGHGGHPNVGDFDGDGKPEIGVAGGFFYTAIDDDMSEMWQLPVQDISSSATGSSLFDFNCDGKVEVVYRDETKLYILDGSSGAILDTFDCYSGTFREYPTILDVNNDGEANIICMCDSVVPTFSRIKAFRSRNSSWSGTRKLVNQFNYFATNINDDLSIPTHQQNHAHPSLPALNGFLNQPSLLDKFGNPLCYVELLDLTLDSLELICNSDTDVILSAYVCNTSKETISSDDILTSVYEDNPLTGGTLVITDTTSLIILPGACEKVDVTLPYNLINPLFIVINDNGLIPALSPQTQFQECDTLNNWDSLSIQWDSLASDSAFILGLEDYYCYDDIADTLTGIPSFGNFIGPGINQDSLFQADISMIGNEIIITYSFLNSGGCLVSTYDTTYVGPNVAFPNDTVICDYDSISLSVTGGSTYSWTPSNGLDDSSMATVLAKPSGTSKYVITVSDSAGCTLTDSMTLSVHPTNLIFPNDSFICLGDTLMLSLQMENIYTWLPGSDVTLEGNGRVSLAPISSTTYSVSNTDSNQCTSSGQVNIIVHTPGKLNAGPDTTINQGDCLRMLVTGAGNSLVFWSPNTFLMWQGTYFVCCPDSSITYYFSALDSNGCTLLDTVRIIVIPPTQVAIPTAFTPDARGDNNLFLPIIEGQIDVDYFEIYNRWGSVIYSSSTPLQGWDGTFKGTPQPAGVYLYYIKYIENESPGSLNGNFVLLR